VAWIFLALCNNDITGKQMLEQGITRDMFLVSCNPNYQQIRHLVITGFAELGRCIDQQKVDSEFSSIQQRIKETAIVGMHSHLVEDAQTNVDLLIAFSTSDDVKFQRTAYWALKDYILLTHDRLIPDVSAVIQAFVNGCLSSEEIIQAECANGLSFIVTHHLVYQSHFNPNISSGKAAAPPILSQDAEAVIERIKAQPVEYVLDAIMYLSGNDSKFIRTTAFSTLSSLSKYSSQCPSVMAQIARDIEIQEHLTSKDYLGFLGERLAAQKALFDEQLKNAAMETWFSGLYSLLRLAQEPHEEEIADATDKYIAFIEQPYDSVDARHLANENYFIKVFQALKHTKNPTILRKLLLVIKFYIYQDDSPCQSEIISPHTILWMLEIMEHQRGEKYLCCLTSSTLLSIVSRHEIHFDYQEVAIIKKFNLALQNIEVFDPAIGDATPNSASAQVEAPARDQMTLDRRTGAVETEEASGDEEAGMATGQRQQEGQDSSHRTIKEEEGEEMRRAELADQMSGVVGGSQGADAMDMEPMALAEAQAEGDSASGASKSHQSGGKQRAVASEAPPNAKQAISAGRTPPRAPGAEKMANEADKAALSEASGAQRPAESAPSQANDGGEGAKASEIVSGDEPTGNPARPSYLKSEAQASRKSKKAVQPAGAAGESEDASE